MSLENKLTKPTPTGLDAVVAKEEREKKLEEKTPWYKMIGQSLLYSVVPATSMALFGAPLTLTTAIPAIGYSLGEYIKTKKKKMKMTWNKLKKQINTGHIMGHVDYAMFSLPEYILSSAPAIFATGTIPSMIAATLIFNPLFVIPVNMTYEIFFYLRDEIGWKNVLSKPWKLGSYVKEAYQNKVKKEWKTDTKNVFKYMFPLHFAQMHGYNWMPDSARVAARLTQSALVNNPIYNNVVDRQNKGKEEKKSAHKPKMDYVPGGKQNNYKMAA